MIGLTATISSRFAKTKALDPDTLHGLLFCTETARQQIENMPTIARIIGAGKLAVMLDRARKGIAGRVRHAYERPDPQQLDYLDGLFPLRWKRSLIDALLRCDGVSSTGVADLLAEQNRVSGPGKAMSTIRADLKVIGVRFEAEKVAGANHYIYRMTGMDYRRMREIIENGWAL